MKRIEKYKGDIFVCRNYISGDELQKYYDILNTIVNNHTTPVEKSEKEKFKEKLKLL